MWFKYNRDRFQALDTIRRRMETISTAYISSRVTEYSALVLHHYEYIAKIWVGHTGMSTYIVSLWSASSHAKVKSIYSITHLVSQCNCLTSAAQ